METVVIIGLLVVGGWILGIVGFFRAGRALGELRELRRALAEGAPGSAVPADPGRAEVPVAAVAHVRSVPVAMPPAAAPVPLQPPEAPEPGASAAPAGDFEAVLTTRWGVWLGAAALLFAGIFLVRYAVEQELLGPAARCGLAAVLGSALLAGAEWLLRHEGPPIAGPLGRDQAPAGLASGGCAILFGAAYGAGPFYGMLPPLLAFAAMAAASFVALAAALRFGQLTAAIGIAGAFATPALVATDTPSLAGLFVYLLVVSAAALTVVRHTAWTWLGWATTIAGAIWVGIAATDPGAPEQWATACFVPAAAALTLFLLPAAALGHPIGRRLAWIPFAVLGLAGLLLEAQVPGAAPRAGLFLLSPIAVGKGFREPRLDRLPWVAALFGLLAMLLWALPAWNPTGEVIAIEGVVQAVLPGAWAPQVIRPLIFAATLFAAFHAAAGLALERRAPRPLHWAALVAAIPVLTLAVAYAQVDRFQPDIAWAAVALALTAALTGTAALAAGERAHQRAGVHASGAVAALALGCAMLLHTYWLTFAVALFLPPLAWIEASADLPPLRRVALAVAALVLVRLLLNWYVLGYDVGATPLANGLLAAYAAPAAAFGVAALKFRRRGDDLLVATLEAGAVALAACFVALEIRHLVDRGRLTGPFAFSELALHLLTLAIQATAYLHLARRTGRPMLRFAWRILGGIALASATFLLVFNPALIDSDAGAASLFAAYLAPAALAAHAAGRVGGPRLRRTLAGYAVAAGFAWITLQIRDAFHPGALALSSAPITDAELWSWSGAWLLYGIALMAQGIRAEERGLRLAALGVVGLVCAKVFLVDMAGLTGLWRVLSFLGLGLALIGLGVVHRRFVLPAKRVS